MLLNGTGDTDINFKKNLPIKTSSSRGNGVKLSFGGGGTTPRVCTIYVAPMNLTDGGYIYIYIEKISSNK